WESVVITATANESLAERETQIEFTTGNRKVQLDVMQKAPVFTTVEKNVLDFMALHKIPAASVAVTYKEKLVYSKTFGIADVERQMPATNRSVYRTASISKVITMAAILKLVEENLLAVNEKVFGSNSILGYDFASSYVDPRLLDITVDQLLKHEAGWEHAPGD